MPDRTYADMDVEELDAGIAAIARERDELFEESMAMHAERDKRIADANAKEAFANMSEPQKEALRQVITAPPVEDSKESVGTPGS